MRINLSRPFRVPRGPSRRRRKKKRERDRESLAHPRARAGRFSYREIKLATALRVASLICG